MTGPRLPFLLRWVRTALLIRSIRATTWDDATWPTAKVTLARALDMRRQINREGLVELDPSGDLAGRVTLLTSPRQRGTSRRAVAASERMIGTLLRALVVLLGALVSAIAAFVWLVQ